MDKGVQALLAFGLNIAALSFCAATFLYSAPIRTESNKVHVRYFVLLFVSMGFSFLLYSTRSFIPVGLTLIASNFFYLLAVHALLFAFLWRSGRHKHLFSEPLVISNLVAIPLLNCLLFYQFPAVTEARTVVLQSNVLLILILALRAIPIDQSNITPTEKQARYGVIAVMISAVAIITIKFITDDAWIFATDILIIESLVLMLLLGLSLNLVLSDLIKEHYENSIMDSLTGLYNRRYFMSQALTALKQSQRYHSPIAILLCDIDFFKRINDSHGHDAGDRALREFALLLQASIRDVDVVARFGGEEFILLLPQTPLPGAEETAERIIEATRQHSVEWEGNTFGFTVSIGITTCEGDADLQAHIALADQALYNAKHGGRDQHRSKVSPL